MGNSNSTSGGGHLRSGGHHHHGHGHHRHTGYDHGWSHSLETPEQRNRMKRGYNNNNFSPRAYLNGHPGGLVPQPQKVLPTAVNPNKLLKATSNGAILHGGGTISGRKLSEMELDIRKRSTASCPANGDENLMHTNGLGSGRSTPNLMRPRMGISSGAGGGSSSKGSSRSRSGRDYGSEPDLRDVGVSNGHHHNDHFEDGSPDRSVSPLPNSFTLISESPAKKQIRSRKKSKAPPPPGPGGHHDQMQMPMGMMNMNVIPYNMNMNMGMGQIPYQYQLQQNPQRQLLLTPVSHHGDEGSKKKLRLFKTKAESKSSSAAPSPALRSPSASELNHNSNFPPNANCNLIVSRGGPMRASLDPNRLIRGERERISVHSMEGNLSKSQGGGVSSSHPIDRESKVGVKDARNLKPAPLCSPIGGKMTEATNPSATKMSSHAQKQSQSNVSGAIPSNAENAKVSSGLNKVPKNPPPKQAEKSRANPSSQHGKSAVDTNDSQKKTFYFGMDMGTFSHKRAQLQKENNEEDFKAKMSGQSQEIQRPPSSSSCGDMHKEISRRKMLQKIDNDSTKSPSPINVKTNINTNNNAGNPGRNPNINGHANIRPTQTNHGNMNENKGMSHVLNGRGKSSPSPINQNNATTTGNKIQTASSGSPVKQSLHKSNSNNIRSESDSDGIHRRQDSGSFDINDNIARKTRHGNKVPMSSGNGNTKPIRESSSDLSSSDVDVPLVVTRPTLPQKRPELPHFSPTAAWRAIDSPSRTSQLSGRSYDDSSEEFRNHHNSDRIHRYTRPSAPPRMSHERSGDSGISAGDAGSPANPIPLEEADNFGHLETMDENQDFSSSSPVQLRRHLNGKKQGGRMLSADRMMKCWTPEQDLDESSSDFEHDHDPILPPVPPKPISGKKMIVPVSSKCNLFEGKRAAAVVSDTDSKYFGGGSAGGYSDEFSSNRRFHSRSTKSKQHGLNNSSSDGNPSKKRFNYPQNQNPYNGKYSRINNNMINTRQKFNKNHHSPNGFVGLDANWFLSKSEPNSLNYMGISDSNFSPNANHLKLHASNYIAPEQEFRRGKKSGTGREVILGSRKRVPKTNDQDDEFECELQLEDEESGSSDSHNHRGNNTTTSNPVGRGRWNNKESGTSAGRHVGNQNQPHRSDEIGYGPSNMNSNSYEDQQEEMLVQDETQTEDEIEEELMRDDLFDYLDQYEEGEFEREQELTSDNLLTGSKDEHGGNNGKINAGRNGVKAFSHHIMYLPSYDARKLHQKNGPNNPNWRRARSVDHLDSSEVTLFKKSGGPPSPNKRERIIPIHVESEDNHRQSNGRQNPNRKTSVPAYFSSDQMEKNEVQILHKKVAPVKNAPKLASEEVRQENNETSGPQYSREEEERRAQNKKKFKFQSTLRVLERRKIEQELSREAQQREEERLREIEAMKKVEEEFQKKRAKEKQEAEEAAANAANAKNPSPSRPKDELSNFKITSASGSAMSPRIVSSTPAVKSNASSSNYRNISESHVANGHGHGHGHVNGNGNSSRIQLTHQPSTSSAGSSSVNIHVNGRQQYKHEDDNQGRRFNRGLMSQQRQEPEGAPASVSVNSMCNSSTGSGSTTTDLRKELIHASKKRSGNIPTRSSNQELTQELSEFRQETRQYCDYRRAPRQQSLSPARFIQKSSSSDIFPISSRRKAGSSSGGSKASGRSTIHPEVVCDIPARPHKVHASRLGGSHMNLVSEERPNSVIGSLDFNNLSSPSSPSVISDNYRKDWVHHNRGGGGSVLQGGRASSVISLHSGLGYSSDNFRNSASDLSRVPSHGVHHGNFSPRFFPDRAHRLARQYSASPPPSASPLPHSSNESTTTDQFNHLSDKYSSSRASPVRVKSNTTVISIGAPLPHSSGVFQAQPYNKVKNYRPVAFKPTSTTAVN